MTAAFAPLAREKHAADGPHPAANLDQDALVRQGFIRHQLDNTHLFYGGTLPEYLRLDESDFKELWELHPETYHQIKVGGRQVDTPRWQQAYGRDYQYTGQVNKALSVPPMLTPLLVWCQETVDPRLNGILVNWYDGQLGHYIGKHRDSIKNLVSGSPIVTMSFGDERTFRLSPFRGAGYHDFPAPDGTVFVMPSETNLTWKHEVPHRKGNTGRRISVTFRAFV